MTPRFPLFCALLLFVSSAAHAQDSYRTYRNARFGTTIIYPANLVAPRPESANGDGRKFVSSDGQIEITVYGSHNVQQSSARREMARAMSDWKRDGARLTYSKSGPSWFALSGYLGDDIFYEKTLLRDGIFHTLLWQYPKTLKQRLDASVSRSVASFSVGRSPASALPTPTSSPVSQSPIKRRISPRKRAMPKASPSASGY